MDAEEGKADEAIDQVIFKKTFFFLNDLFLYIAIGTVSSFWIFYKSDKNRSF